MDSLEDKPGPEGAWGRSDSQAQGTKEHAGFVWEGETDLEKEHFLSGGGDTQRSSGFQERRTGCRAPSWFGEWGVAGAHTLPKQSRGSVPEYPQSWMPMGVVEKVSFLSSSIPR